MSCPRPATPKSNPKDLRELAEPLRSRTWTMMVDAPRFAGGGPSGLTAVSAYRDPGTQWDLRHARCRGRECDRSCKGYPTTAVPAAFNPRTGEWEGGSLHQHRKAVDLGGVDLDWAIANRFAYGVGLTVVNENWHFEASGWDVVARRPIPAPTRRILPFPTRATSPVPHPTRDLVAQRPPTPTTTPPPKEDLTMSQANELHTRIDRLRDGTVLLVRALTERADAIDSRIDRLRDGVLLGFRGEAAERAKLVADLDELRATSGGLRSEITGLLDLADATDRLAKAERALDAQGAAPA